MRKTITLWVNIYPELGGVSVRAMHKTKAGAIFHAAKNAMAVGVPVRFRMGQNIKKKSKPTETTK